MPEMPLPYLGSSVEEVDGVAFWLNVIKDHAPSDHIKIVRPEYAEIWDVCQVSAEYCRHLLRAESHIQNGEVDRAALYDAVKHFIRNTSSGEQRRLG